MSDPNLLSTPDAARLMGVPDEEFTRLVKALGIEPARPGTKSQPRMWHKPVVEQLNRGPEGEELREAVVRREKIRALRAEMETRYPDWRQALLPAAYALFNFNRLAKWASCSRLRRRHLYTLKDSVIRLLYECGLCQEASIHSVAGTEVDCDVCDATGKDLRDVACVRCSGRGVLIAEQPLEYVLFGFLVEGRWFEWHSPRKAVEWPFTPTPSQSKRDWRPRAGEKPVQIEAEADTLEAEAHLSFVLRKYAEEKEAQREKERQARREQMRAEGLARQAQLRAEREAAEKKEGPPSEG